MANQDLAEIIKRIEKLEKVVFRTAKKEALHTLESNDMDFSLGERAFIKRYAKDKSSTKKFALLVAYLAKGETDKNIPSSEIVEHWNKMKMLLGKFNWSYSLRAKESGWVNSEQGNYKLTKEWRDAR